MSVYDQFGIRRVINGRSYSTKVGGCLMAPEVLEAMQGAAKSFVRIEDLQEAASRVIAEATGAEAGMATSGASAALTLAAAACLAAASDNTGYRPSVTRWVLPCIFLTKTKVCTPVRPVRTANPGVTVS